MKKYIEIYLNVNNLSFREFSKICQIPNSTLQSMCEKTLLSASLKNVQKLTEVLMVDAENLLEDRNVEFYEEFLRKKDFKKKTSILPYTFFLFEKSNPFFSLSKFDESHMLDFKALSFAGQQAISFKTSQLLKKEQNSRLLKVFLQPAAAGFGNFLDDSSYDEILFNDPPRNADFCIKISGDSMEPEICDKEIVFVKKQDELSEGDVGIFVVDGDAFCKQLVRKGRKTILRSFNEKYRDMDVSEREVFCVGKVLS